MRNVCMLSLMCLALLAMQVQAGVENFDKFTALTYNTGYPDLLTYAQAIAPYNTEEGGWIFASGGSSFALSPTGGPDGSKCITRNTITTGFASSFAYVIKNDKALKGVQKLEFDLRFNETLAGSNQGWICVKVHGINPSPAGGAWAGVLEDGGGTGSGGPQAATKYFVGTTDPAPDGVRLLNVANNTTSGATNAITRGAPGAGWQHYSFNVDFGTGYEWIHIGFGHGYGTARPVALTDPATVFAVDNVSFYTLGLVAGAAHTPVPAKGDNLVDSTAVTSVSWYSPAQDENGNLLADPNLTVTGYDVRFGTNPDPNSLTPVFTTSQSFPVTLAYNTTYYWRVDAKVIFGGTSTTSTVKGRVWQFTTKPAYIAPVLTFNGVITLLPLLPANLSASVTGNSLPITSAVFTLLTNDVTYPAGAVANLADTTTNNQNPTATLTADKEGKYKVKLVISDGTTTLEKISEVLVYTDACAAKKASQSGWTANYYDLDGSCIVNLNDFAILAQNWLNDTSMKVQELYTGTVSYLPQSIFDARIEAESVNAVDPNWVSDFPITDLVGIRINENVPGAIGGGKSHGTTANGFVQYTINIPVAGTYDLHLYSAAAAAGNVLSFGVAGTPDLYGSVADLPANGWTNYTYTVHPGALTFTAAGPTIVRITWNATGRDLDWFTLVKQ